MSDYIDETSLTDEEVAAAIAEARAKKAAKAKKASLEKPETSDDEPKQAQSIDAGSSDDLLNESSAAAAEEEEDSPAVKSAKDFSNAFAAAKKKREQDLLKKKEESRVDEEEDEAENESAVILDADDADDAEFETDDEDDYEDYDEEDEEESEEDYDEEDEDDDEEEFDNDGIFETDDENGEYNTAAVIDDDGDEEDSDDDDDEDEDENDSTFSTKTKVIIGVIIAVLVIAIIAAAAFFMKNTGSNAGGDKPTASASNGEITSVRFEESSVNIQVGQTVPLKLIVEPADATDKSFKLKSNDMGIAKVNEKCEVIGIASGSTTVTATLKSNPTMTASIVVNVIDEEQSTLNTYNKFINSILDGSTDIDLQSDEDTDENTEENGEEQTETDSDVNSDSDTDTSKTQKKSTHTLTGNKIRDLDSDGSLELALYYEPSTDNAEPLVRVFHMVSEDDTDSEEETDSEPEQLYDEFGNPIEAPETDTQTETDSAAGSDNEPKAPAEKTLREIDQTSELYSVCKAALEESSADDAWNTSFVQVKENEQTTAKVQILSEGYAAPTYTYESEDEKIATVDKQGNIKGVKPGTVFITVSSPLNSEAVAKVKVRVKDDTDLLEDYLAAIPTVDSTNDSVFPTQTLTGKAIVDIDNDGVSELLVRLRYSDNVEVINLVKVENEKCVVYKTYNNLSDLYEYNEGRGSYSNAILIHYTTGKVCMDYKAAVEKEGSKSKSTEEKILTIESGGSLSEMVNFRTTTDVTTKTVTSEVDAASSRNDTDTEEIDTDIFYDDTDSDEITSPADGDEDTDGTSSYVDEDNDGYDDITGEYFGSFAAVDFDDIADNGINLTANKPVKVLPYAVGAPGDDDDDEDDDAAIADDDDDDDDTTTSQRDDDDTTSKVTTEVTEEVTKYFVNGTSVEKGVYEEVVTQYTATYSVWNAWESVYQ